MPKLSLEAAESVMALVTRFVFPMAAVAVASSVWYRQKPARKVRICARVSLSVATNTASAASRQGSHQTDGLTGSPLQALFSVPRASGMDWCAPLKDNHKRTARVNISEKGVGLECRSCSLIVSCCWLDRSSDDCWLKCVCGSASPCVGLCLTRERKKKRESTREQTPQAPKPCAAKRSSGRDPSS